MSRIAGGAAERWAPEGDGIAGPQSFLSTVLQSSVHKPHLVIPPAAELLGNSRALEPTPRSHYNCLFRFPIPSLSFYPYMGQGGG